jgi:hypothetical protein
MDYFSLMLRISQLNIRQMLRTTIYRQNKQTVSGVLNTASTALSAFGNAPKNATVGRQLHNQYQVFNRIL